MASPRPRHAGLAGLLLLAASASSQLIVSLDRLENLSILRAPFSCRVAYGAVLIGCDGSSFSNKACSARCQQSVADVQSSVQRTCGNADPGATRLLTSALQGTLVTDLCGTRAGQNNGETPPTTTTQPPTTVTGQPTTVTQSNPQTTATSTSSSTSTTTNTPSTTLTTNTRSTTITNINPSTTVNPIIFPTTTQETTRITFVPSTTPIRSTITSLTSSTTLATSTVPFLPGTVTSIPTDPTTIPPNQPPESTSTSSSAPSRPTRIPGSGGGSPADFAPAVAASRKLDCKRALASVVVGWGLVVLLAQ
ncbi:hypothetical protein HIM_05441 [Hirsutella minnesotensis 3608]|uniref:Extracellular membrane protein CFEM domain-containing protein n=1 Tax=Hirsutella minnesotensis 3608 TaxID=1043627 RepID=A0A0F8A0D3_9HYPO|nr:hypothetical protein HIM_05441 [Hirsutella minnesotensis 3608]